ncbi:protein kinase domain-containing protein [Paraglaciecola arctica]|uniref:protein kinase domain-containing protein n=1 Tax=Paraglaciecola arctica TaxID=1128911 RepID=UPI001C075FB6|nr:protein kinase [Paraglaciecola arctica]MBU3004995.1 protein kinase [Paraglaciecola arctica]
MLNKTIGRYEIKEMIGEGAMAKVYRAYDPEINRSVAFKVLKEDHCVDEEYLSRFLREAKAAGALSHSGIVTVYDVGKFENAPYIMMELLDGSDLGEVLKKEKKLSLKQTLIIALQLAKSLDYAHKSGIIHRDIKPDNIIVMPDGESIKVADFGIARMNETEESQKTQVGSVLGTPRYMSPEQALGNPVDGRSDLFSVGTIMYEMLSGNKAFDAGNMATLMIQIAQKQPEPLKTLCPEIPAGVRQIIQKLLQKSPDKRFQTGNKLAEALGKELSTLSDQQAEQKKHKYIPLKIRWTLSVGAIVGLVSFISINIVFNMQSKAMTKQAVDSGASFAKFISTETAIPILSEDWISLETFIGDAASRDTFSYLIVTDRSGIVRGASDNTLVGKIYQPNENDVLVSETEDVHTTSTETADGKNIFNIRTPILFQSTEVGQIILGLSQDGLDEVKSITGSLMFILALITTSSVAVVMFIFGGLIARPFKVLNQSLKGFAAGNLDTRISLTRNDEIGEVFDCFNNMAAAIQDRYTEVTDELAQTGIDKTGVTADKPDDTGSHASEAEVKEVEKQESESADLGPDETVISNSQIDLVNKPNQDAIPKAQENIEPTEVSEVQSNIDSVADADADRTIISSSQINLDIASNESDEKNPPKEPQGETPDTESVIEENPDQTVIASSQIIMKSESTKSDDVKVEPSTADSKSEKIDAEVSSTEQEIPLPTKKPPAKRRTPRKPAKAKVKTEDAATKDAIADSDQSAKS